MVFKNMSELKPTLAYTPVSTHDFSVIISTRNRSKEITMLLKSILKQTLLPRKIIIIDDSEDEKTKKIISQINIMFQEKEINLIYIKGEGRGLPAARNLGTLNSTGRICCHIDDDIILSKNYFEEIFKIFIKYPNAIGVGGYIVNYPLKSVIKNTFNKIFFLYHKEKNKCRVQLSGFPTYPYNLDEIIKCEWLSGSNVCYKRKIIREIKWDENLPSQLGEDHEISYIIHKKYRNSLYMTPAAKVYHYPGARRNIRVSAYEEIIYATYFFFNFLTPSFIKYIVFLWNRLGRIISSLFYRDLLFLLKAHIYTYKNLENIKKGKLKIP